MRTPSEDVISVFPFGEKTGERKRSCRLSSHSISFQVKGSRRTSPRVKSGQITLLQSGEKTIAEGGPDIGALECASSFPLAKSQNRISFQGVVASLLPSGRNATPCKDSPGLSIGKSALPVATSHSCPPPPSDRCSKLPVGGKNDGIMSRWALMSPRKLLPGCHIPVADRGEPAGGSHGVVIG
jgi:hypothetical protein